MDAQDVRQYLTSKDVIMDGTSEHKQPFAYKIAPNSIGPSANGAKIKVIGVGGGGGNVINYMAQQGLDGVDLIAANTDIQDLNTVPDSVDRIQLGAMRTRGLGAGMDPEVGSAAAQESMGELEECLRGADMVFLIACMGGGTGTGASHVIAEIAKEMSILTVGVVTRPFNNEQETRLNVAQTGIRRLHSCVDALITIPNDKLTKILGGEVLFWDAFNHINAYLAETVGGIADIVNVQGVVNLDFADVKSVLSSNGKGVTVIGTGSANGQNRAEEATLQAIKSPLLEDMDLKGSRNALFNIKTGKLTLDEFNTISRVFSEMMHASGRVFSGVVEDPTMEDDIEVTVLVTGVNDTFGVRDESIAQLPNRHLRTVDKVANSNEQFSSRESGNKEDSEREAKVVGARERNPGPGRGRRISASDIPALFRDQAD